MDKILAILKETRPEFDFSQSNDFVGDGMLDSLDVVMLVAGLEKSFGVSIPGTQIAPENFRSLPAIQQLLERLGARV